MYNKYQSSPVQSNSVQRDSHVSSIYSFCLVNFLSGTISTNQGYLLDFLRLKRSLHCFMDMMFWESLHRMGDAIDSIKVL
jgi:hypothetical protein